MIQNVYYQEVFMGTVHGSGSPGGVHGIFAKMGEIKEKLTKELKKIDQKIGEIAEKCFPDEPHAPTQEAKRKIGPVEEFYQLKVDLETEREKIGEILDEGQQVAAELEKMGEEFKNPSVRKAREKEKEKQASLEKPAKGPKSPAKGAEIPVEKDLHKQLAERGEKLNELENKSNNFASNAEKFAQLAKKLKNKQLE